MNDVKTPVGNTAYKFRIPSGMTDVSIQVSASSLYEAIPRATKIARDQHLISSIGVAHWRGASSEGANNFVYNVG